MGEYAFFTGNEAPCYLIYSLLFPFYIYFTLVKIIGMKTLTVHH